MTRPVSVIIPVYNAGGFLSDSCASALAQSETGEVLLVEDGSTDQSLEICMHSAQNDARVRVLRHPGGVNRGAAASRNLGMRAARCPLIAFLDADDYYLPGRFARACELLEADQSLDGVYDAVGVVFENSEAESWWRRTRKTDLTTLDALVPPEDLLECLLASEHGHFCTDGIVFRKGLADRTGGFPEHLKMAEDTCLWLKMACAGRLAGGVLDKPLAIRRVHGENTIVRHGGRAAYFEYAARREVLRWLPRDLRTPGRLQLLRAATLNWRLRYLHTTFKMDSRHLPYFASVATLLLGHPLLLRDPYFRHCAKEAAGLLALRDYLKRG